MKHARSRKHVFVIILNWNGASDTCACLDTLRNVSCVPSKLRTSMCHVSAIVVDNGSIDDSVAKIRKNFPHVEVLEAGKNFGFTGGNNIGIRRALEKGADFVWLLNNDTTVDKNALEPLVHACNAPTVGIVGSKIYFQPGQEYHKQWYGERDRGRVLWYAGGIIDWNNMYALHRGVDEVDKGQYDAVAETPFITGCSMMVKKEVFKKIGLLDQKFFAYLEDVDFCLRAKRAGYKFLYVPQSVVWHKNAGSSGVGSDTHQYYMTRNRLLVGFRYARLHTKVALAREAMLYIVMGPSVRRRAVMDAIGGRWGKV